MLSDFKGYGMPLTQRGQASAYAPAPWHLSGRVLTIWYRLQDPDEARRHIAPPLEVPHDPLCRARFYELVQDAGMGDELIAQNPEQSRFHEAVIAIECGYKDLHGDFSVHMYSDNATYIAWAREVVGWALKSGKVTVTQLWNPYELKPGDQLTGILERFGTQLMKASITLTEPLPRESYPTAPPNWFTYKVIPNIENPVVPDVCQLIVAGPSRVAVGTIWKAEGTLEIGEGFNDELHFLRPREITAADYWSHVDLTVGHGRVLKNLLEK